jgi:enoyl-[acyl-carrier protein] reductase I
MLKGKKGLVVGVANEKSIAFGCAKAMRLHHSELAITYLNDKALPHVKPLMDEISPSIFSKLDVQNDQEMEDLFLEIGQKWGQLDFMIHSIAFAQKESLMNGVVACSREGFLEAMDISCHSFIRLAKYAKPLMKKGGALLTMSYLGSQKFIPNYSVMGPVKAALESTVRYLAFDLGGDKIRVNAVSPGPIKTRAASGLKDFDTLIDRSSQGSAIQDPLDTLQVGALAAFLVSDSARHITGQVMYVDNGYSAGA